MPHTRLLLEAEAREKVLRGAAALAAAVRLTLGPRSRSVLVGRRWGKPVVCNDGVTIARTLELEDPEENLGAQVLKEAAEKTGDAVGDGTTTATLLAFAIYGDGMRSVAARASAIDLKRGLDRALPVAVEALRALSRPVASHRERMQAATISAHNDPEIGRMVADAFEKIGPEGAISVEEAKGTETTLEVVEGMQFDRGYLSPTVLTGGRVVSEELGVRLEHVSPEFLGRARRVVVEQQSTTLVGGGGAEAAVKARCDEIRARMAETESDYDREKLQERLARLSGGVAVIGVGAPSEAEMRSRKEAFDDAISATRAAVAEGIVPGGGLALLRAIDAVEAEAAKCEGDERTGALILRRALEAPARQIAENSGADPGVVVERMRAGSGAYGFDAARGEYVDLAEAGIVDPTRVVRMALENAVSVAGVLLLTEATLTELPEEDAEPQPGLEG